MNGKKFTVRWSETGKRLLASIPDKRIQKEVYKRTEKLESDPAKQGKALVDDLAGYRGVRAVGGRYRIIYRIDLQEALVFVVAVGLRKEGDKKDVYAIARKLLRHLEDRLQSETT